MGADFRLFLFFLLIRKAVREKIGEEAGEGGLRMGFTLAIHVLRVARRMEQVTQDTCNLPPPHLSPDWGEQEHESPSRIAASSQIRI